MYKGKKVSYELKFLARERDENNTHGNHASHFFEYMPREEAGLLIVWYVVMHTNYLRPYILYLTFGD